MKRRESTRARLRNIATDLLLTLAIFFYLRILEFSFLSAGVGSEPSLK